MLKKFELRGIHTEIDDKLRAHAEKKIGGLDRYIARHNQDSAHMEVHLKETGKKGNDQCRCEVTLHLPHQTIVVKESALNMYAAIDIVEAKLKQQLQKYKDQHGSGKMHRRLFHRLSRNNAKS